MDSETYQNFNTRFRVQSKYSTFEKKTTKPNQNHMKKILLSISASLLLMTGAWAQTRYVEPVFPESKVKITSNIKYAANYGVLTGTPVLGDLFMDIYEPDSDAVTSRPVILYIHTGSFLPRYINNLPTGAKDDSATVEICKQFARRGYVVAAISYRLGWNPLAPTETDRATSIINAVYKTLQDAHTAVRFLKANAVNYGIDTTKVVVGGQGSGGYTAFAYAAVDRQEEIKIAKFFNFDTNRPFVNDTIWGNRYGLGGLTGFNMESNPGHRSDDVKLAFSIGGCMGDTSWLEAGEIPLISVHPIYDPFGPYKTAMVKVPGTNFNVVEVSGGYTVLKKADMLGNTAPYKGKIMDEFTHRAN